LRSPCSLTIFAFVVFVVGCGSGHRPEPQIGPVRIGVLPDRSEEELRRRYEPLVAFLEASSGLDAELVVPPDYDAFVEAFCDERLDLAWFGGLTYLRAERACGALPLVMRDVDLVFTSDFLVARSAAGGSIDDFAGKAFAFGPRGSTSGHLMPRFYLQRMGIDAEQFFRNVQHTAGHDQTAAWVQTGRVDLGVVNSVVVDSMLRDGRLSGERVRVLQTTHPYRNYVWAARPDIDVEVRQRLVDAFQSLDAGRPGHGAILSLIGARGYVPASRNDYDDLREVADSLGLLEQPGAPI